MTVGTDLADDLPAVHGDRVQVQQVLLNLIVNAGRGRWAGRGGAARALHVANARNKEADGVVVSVSDSGLGFAADSIDQVFQAFYTTKSSRLGMGLSICRSIIEAHGGRL